MGDLLRKLISTCNEFEKEIRTKEIVLQFKMESANELYRATSELLRRDDVSDSDKVKILQSYYRYEHH